MIGVPLLREGLRSGSSARPAEGPRRSPRKQIALVTTFADQAVIAIENARLLNDLRQRTHDLQESLEYQTATSDVLKVVSRSTLTCSPYSIRSSRRQRVSANADSAIFRLHDGRVYRMAAAFGVLG